MQLVVPVANNTVHSSCTVCSGAQQKWKIQGWTFFNSQQDQGSFEALSQSVVMVMFWRLVFILSDETTWPRKVTSLLRKWHLVGFSFKPAVLLRWNTYRKQWMCSSKIWAQMMILSKYTRECVQVRPLSTRLINRVKLAGPFVNLKGITLVHLFNSFSGHEPAQRECVQTGLMRGAIPTQSHHPLRLASPRGCTTRTLF